MATADAAVCLAHGLKVPCLVVTVESLRLLNAAHAGEKGKREAAERALKAHKALAPIECPPDATPFGWEIGRASCRERV